MTEETAATSSEYDDTNMPVYVLSVISCLIAVLGIVSNLLSLSYFIRQTRFKPMSNQRENGTARLFVILNVFDLLVCLYSTIMIIIWVKVLNMGYTVVFKYFCVIYQDILVNLTGFITCIIAVTRTLDLIWPFNVARGAERIVITNIAIVVYSLLNLCLAIFEMVHISGRELGDITYIALSMIAIIMIGLFQNSVNNKKSEGVRPMFFASFICNILVHGMCLCACF